MVKGIQISPFSKSSAKLIQCRGRRKHFPEGWRRVSAFGEMNPSFRGNERGNLHTRSHTTSTVRRTTKASGVSHYATASSTSAMTWMKHSGKNRLQYTYKGVGYNSQEKGSGQTMTTTAGTDEKDSVTNTE